MLHTGRKPFVHDKRDFTLESQLTQRSVSLPTSLPIGFGRGTDFPYWGMKANGPPDDNDPLPSSWTAANNGCGDCTCADATHTEEMNAHDSGRTPVNISAKTTVDQYCELTEAANGAGQGYDPVTGANDSGLEVRFVLSHRQKTGWRDDAGNHYKIGQYYTVEVGNWQLLRQACWLFPGLTLGINMTTAQMDQFNSGEMWKYVAGSPDEGGHDVPLVGHPQPGLWTVLSWGKRVVCTYDFLLRQCEEIWVYADMERISTVTGKTYNNVSEVDGEEYIALMARQVRNTHG